MAPGPLVPGDERLEHQVTETFATVAQSDRAWTEKVWSVAAARDGSLQLAFGLGKYPNRGVMDGYAGVSRGREQWTVRATRRLAPRPWETAVGPLRYEVEEPLERVRCVLERNDAAPLAFEYVLSGVAPPGLEERELHRSADGYRVEADVLRYHQACVASGWVDIDGTRIELDEQAWFGARDHSWGVRYHVGAPPVDVAPGRDVAGVSSTILWCPVACERADGSRYGLHWYYQSHRVGALHRTELQGAVEGADGRRTPFASMTPRLRFRDDNRRFVGGTVDITLSDSTTRRLRLAAVSDTGFHLGPALYLGYGDRWHGQWRGTLAVEAEHLADCADPATARRIHQLRDCVVSVDDPDGGGRGWGILQSIVTGADEEVGLTEDASFL